MEANNTITIQLPADARSPFIENNNELNWYQTEEGKAGLESMKLPTGKWKIVKWDQETKMVFIDKASSF